MGETGPHVPAADVADDGDAVPRSTPQRRAIEAAIAELDDFRSAQHIHAALRAAGHTISLATVYRGVQWLVDNGRVDVVKNDAGESLYRQCSRTHHHHLVCRRCGRTVEIEGPAAEAWATRVAEQHGYADVNHTIELFGTCGPCRRALADEARSSR